MAATGSINPADASGDDARDPRRGKKGGERDLQPFAAKPRLRKGVAHLIAVGGKQRRLFCADQAESAGSFLEVASVLSDGTLRIDDEIEERRGESVEHGDVSGVRDQDAGHCGLPRISAAVLLAQK